MSLSKNCIAVGVARSEGDESMPSGSTLSLPKDAARKLADDLLRNANYLWPIESEK